MNGLAALMLKHTLPIMLLGLALSCTVDAAPRSYGPVKDQDTLWTIADRLRPDNTATVQQTMLALYYKNPQAFASNNINSLMKGVSLKAPSSAEARRYKRLAALREARKHNHFWKRGVDLPRSEPPPVPKLKERAVTKRSKPTVVKTAAKTPTYTTIPRNATRRLARLQAQLQIAEAKNQELTSELKSLQAKQSQGKPNPQLDAQVKKLKIELQELTSVLDQKDNHIKTLQASLKNASETIKAQHADNMRLFDKLKEVSPASVPNSPSSAGKSELKLTTVEASTATIAGTADPKAAAEANKNAAKPSETATKAEAPSTPASTTTTENKEPTAKSVWADESKTPTPETKPATPSTEAKPSSETTTTANPNTSSNQATEPNTSKPSTEPQTLAAAVPSTTPTAKPENATDQPATEASKTEGVKPSTEATKTATKPNEVTKVETAASTETTKPENKPSTDVTKPSESTEKSAKPEDKTTGVKPAEDTKPNDSASKTAEAKTNADTGIAAAASKSPATASSETGSEIKAPSGTQTAANLEPTNDVKTSSSVPVSQMLAQSGNQGSTGASTNSSAPLRGVSPLALAVALLSLLFILAMVWRAFVQQREMRRLEEEEARVAERMRRRLEENQSSAASTSTATVVEKKDPDLDATPEIKF